MNNPITKYPHITTLCAHGHVVAMVEPYQPQHTPSFEELNNKKLDSQELYVAVNMKTDIGTTNNMPQNATIISRIPTEADWEKRLSTLKPGMGEASAITVFAIDSEIAQKDSVHPTNVYLGGFKQLEALCEKLSPKTATTEVPLS